MARPLIPATPREVYRVDSALYHLRQARDALTGRAKGDKAAESPVAPQALERVNAAIKSAEGALRHVQRRADATAAPRPDPARLPSDHPDNFTDRLI